MKVSIRCQKAFLHHNIAFPKANQYILLSKTVPDVIIHQGDTRNGLGVYPSH